MKLVSIFTMTAITAATLTGCGGGDGGDKSNTDQATQTELSSQHNQNTSSVESTSAQADSALLPVTDGSNDTDVSFEIQSVVSNGNTTKSNNGHGNRLSNNHDNNGKHTGQVARVSKTVNHQAVGTTVWSQTAPAGKTVEASTSSITPKTVAGKTVNHQAVGTTVWSQTPITVAGTSSVAKTTALVAAQGKVAYSAASTITVASVPTIQSQVSPKLTPKLITDTPVAKQQFIPAPRDKKLTPKATVTPTATTQVIAPTPDVKLEAPVVTKAPTATAPSTPVATPQATPVPETQALANQTELQVSKYGSLLADRAHAPLLPNQYEPTATLLQETPTPVTQKNPDPTDKEGIHEQIDLQKSKYDSLLNQTPGATPNATPEQIVTEPNVTPQGEPDATPIAIPSATPEEVQVAPTANLQGAPEIPEEAIEQGIPSFSVAPDALDQGQPEAIPFNQEPEVVQQTPEAFETPEQVPNVEPQGEPKLVTYEETFEGSVEVAPEGYNAPPKPELVAPSLVAGVTLTPEVIKDQTAFIAENCLVNLNNFVSANGGLNTLGGLDFQRQSTDVGSLPEVDQLGYAIEVFSLLQEYLTETGNFSATANAHAGNSKNSHTKEHWTVDATNGTYELSTDVNIDHANFTVQLDGTSGEFILLDGNGIKFARVSSTGKAGNCAEAQLQVSLTDN
ncbi:hypothetical protein ONE56_08830 [Vibrio mytili]|uniref:hypothetical protein n=1 Tax=Vibrio mytili TaxID=50718 RepID=UPI003C6ED784